MTTNNLLPCQFCGTAPMNTRHDYPIDKYNVSFDDVIVNQIKDFYQNLLRIDATLNPFKRDYAFNRVLDEFNRIFGVKNETEN